MTTQEAFVDSVDQRSDRTERAVWSLIYTVHIFILDYNWIVSFYYTPSSEILEFPNDNILISSLVTISTFTFTS